jgi:hypothetical protein
VSTLTSPLTYSTVTRTRPRPGGLVAEFHLTHLVGVKVELIGVVDHSLSSLDIGECRARLPHSVYLFQNAGDSSARTVNISSLPSSMQTVSTTRPKGLTISKLSVAPT